MFYEADEIPERRRWPVKSWNRGERAVDIFFSSSNTPYTLLYTARSTIIIVVITQTMLCHEEDVCYLLARIILH